MLSDAWLSMGAFPPSVVAATRGFCERSLFLMTHLASKASFVFFYVQEHARAAGEADRQQNVTQVILHAAFTSAGMRQSA